MITSATMKPENSESVTIDDMIDFLMLYRARGLGQSELSFAEMYIAQPFELIEPMERETWH